jgi:UDPglucose 6-dehydrogenase
MNGKNWSTGPASSHCLLAGGVRIADICIVGAGHAGLVTAACFAELGHRVSCLDVNSRKIEALKQGVVPFFEPGLDEMVRQNLASGRLSFTTSYKEGLGGKGSTFIAVNIPSSPGGRTDLRYIYKAAKEVAGAMEEGSVVVIKSKVPVGTTERVGGLLAAERGHAMPRTAFVHWRH